MLQFSFLKQKTGVEWDNTYRLRSLFKLFTLSTLFLFSCVITDRVSESAWLVSCISFNCSTNWQQHFSNCRPFCCISRSFIVLLVSSAISEADIPWSGETNRTRKDFWCCFRHPLIWGRGGAWTRYSPFRKSDLLGLMSGKCDNILVHLVNLVFLSSKYCSMRLLSFWCRSTKLRSFSISAAKSWNFGCVFKWSPLS